ncbi:MAG TPA: hypothetical protein DIT13_11010 [Verrucomicrobiales bacterium]|nr:hypothetical protein [Verrucomicrobiales bacterium]HRJ10466.1 hypothetical protein [Prosthecobacter sp.]HRK15402.1 hypothetical protein [Prosthecobacter sp.]
MKHARTGKFRGGFTSLELVLVMFLSAVLIGAVVISYGALVRAQPKVSSMASVPLGSARVQHYYGASGTSRNVPVAPHYGMLALAEELREQFLHDVISATAVFCLPRESHNTWRPSRIPWSSLEHEELDTPQKFRAHVIAAAGVPASLYRDYRNPLGTSETTPSPNATIFILGFSKSEGHLSVSSIYDVDVVRFTGAAEPQGFHASVKRYAPKPAALDDEPLVYSSGYEVFFPPSNPVARSLADWSSDDFTPLFVTFERSSRLSVREGAAIDRFKTAAERPFYFIWWPDPAMRHLGMQTNTAAPATPQHAYNHMAGRTAFMFTVPMFPAL